MTNFAEIIQRIKIDLSYNSYNIHQYRNVWHVLFTYISVSTEFEFANDIMDILLIENIEFGNDRQRITDNVWILVLETSIWFILINSS